MIVKVLIRHGLAAGLIGLTAVATAQEPSPSATATARELLEAKGASSMVDTLVPGIVETVKNTFLPTHPSLVKELNDVTAQLRTEYAPRRAEVLNELARPYAQRFSEQEMKEIIVFYRSPIGKKFAAEEPAAIDEGLRRAQTWSNRLSEEIISRLRTEMKKKGHDL
jgi:uncharacterized protein